MTQNQIHEEINKMEENIIIILNNHMKEQDELRKENAQILERNILDNNALNLTIKSLQTDMKTLIQENQCLKNENLEYKQKWEKLQNTDEILEKIMQKNNKWWILDSVEESSYRKIIETIQQL
tara:strand:- start:629 stop:997 length:369 start_codon:yes stop_codon:yes gene_type:complete